MLQDKIMKLYENGDIIFYDKITTSNIKTMVSLGPHHLPPIIRFSFFEPIEHDIIFLRSFTVSRWASLHIGHNILLLKVGRSYNIKRGKKKR
jgi:hypothetical protein